MLQLLGPLQLFIVRVKAYDLSLMPGFPLEVFESLNDTVANQLNVKDIDNTLFRPWALRLMP